MANQKAIFTTRNEFEAGRIDSVSFVSYLRFDGENLPTDQSVGGGSYSNSIAWGDGNPTIVDGVVGKASKFNNNHLVWHNWEFPAFSKMSLSFWVKFDPTDFNTWTILATTRGDGYSTNRGIHVAAFTSRSLNIRLYGTNGASIDVYTTTSGQSGKLFEAGVWYHVAVIFDGTNLKAIVNGEQWINIYAGNITFTTLFERSFTLGDMIDGNSYPFSGIIDEFNLCLDDNALTESKAIQYYNEIADGRTIDTQTVDGSIVLAKGFDGLHPTNVPVSWYSPTIDLGGQGQFVDFGYIEAVGQLPSIATTLTFFTRSSADGMAWEEWRQVDIDGMILSTNQRYLEVRIDLATTDGMLTPQLDELRIMEDVYPEPIPELPNTLVRSTDPLTLYIDHENGLSSLGEVKNAYDLIIEEEINGEDKMTFKLPRQDKKRKEVGEDPVEMVAVIGERHYIVKEVIDKRNDDGKIYSEFICEAQWTELRDWYAADIEVVEVSAKTALQTIVANVFREEGDPEFDWTIGRVDIQKKRTLRSDWADVLTLVREVQNTWGGEVLFDTKNKVIHLLDKIGKDSGVRFYYNKNLKNIERTIDTYDLVTRIYPTGKGGLDITTVNNGVPYLENTKWVNGLKLRRKIIPYRWKDERYTIPMNLKEDAQKLLDEMSKPKIAYKLSIHDLSTLSGHEHESFELGDTVTAVDAELFDEEIVNRIVRRKQDVRKPENTEVELAQPFKTLADIQSRALDDQIQTLVESDPLSTTDVQQMTVFNQLLNSRADDGFSSWVHTANGTQFELANAGFSGAWSFKVTPNFNVDAQLTQTVEGVSHRSTYTVSAAVATEGEITKGSSNDAFVGIKVLVYYEGETQPEVHYLGIPDITTNEGGA
ncbi:phage tail spike protein [Cytobacillus pseudoceanisediminis]|uniref:phage tail spike protein n=1 Tax=Cytobacillus pseudoceanisediminis TaxID=3051614 RepID=UPI003CF9B580